MNMQTQLKPIRLNVVRLAGSLAFLFYAALVNAQTFNCGSNGSYGAMNITQTTNLQIPPDGVFHCTTVNIAKDAGLQFTKNALNTPVYILATGNVTIAGTIICKWSSWQWIFRQPRRPRWIFWWQWKHFSLPCGRTRPRAGRRRQGCL